ncbi:stage V sporulation protein B [Paenibacillus sp. GP183]|uniref:stage V sporulation protein B n=1 Tax=Paenibacillus sp. GP183 TaxID=1882751 RepID=UPI0008967AC3|nr:stage V sporulation protein B [Paenibacillus sp. GP183]SEB57477.1 stage V sporulation protein B [Paenibacillus sp. GP183]
MQKQSFVRGTVILATAAFITRILVFVNGIILSRLLGTEGIGLLMMAHPLVPLVITLTELGLPVAISKLVSEADAQGNPLKVKRILVVSLIVTGTLSVILTLISFFCSKMIASVFLPDQRAYYSMIAITPIAPIIAISAVLKGYFRGKQNMKPLAFSEVIEHLVQIIFIFVMVRFLLPYGIEYATAGAMISVVIGEGAGLLCVYSMFRLYNKKIGIKHKLSDSLLLGKQTLFELLHIGLPTMGNGVLLSIYSAFLPMIVTKSIGLSGISTVAATEQYGLLFGYAFPLLFLPNFITRSLSTALIPAISEAMANHNGMLMHRRMDQAMQIALFVGAPSTVILYVWAVPITTVIYHSPDAGALLKILAPFFFLYYFESPLYAILLGLGKAAAVMWNNIIANLCEVVAIIILGSKFGVHGVAIGLAFGMFVLTLLNFSSISSIIGFYVDMRNIMKAAFGVLIMTICGISAFSFMEHTGYGLTWNVLGTICLSILVYVMSLKLTKVIKLT